MCVSLKKKKKERGIPSGVQGTFPSVSPSAIWWKKKKEKKKRKKRERKTGQKEKEKGVLMCYWVF